MAANIVLTWSFVGTTPATGLLLYEPFDYTAGDDLNAKSGGTGFDPASSWSTAITNGGFMQIQPAGIPSGVLLNDGVTPNPFAATYTHLASSGNYAGMNNGGTGSTALAAGVADHQYMWRKLAPDVTATFADGNTTWLSYWMQGGKGTGTAALLYGYSDANCPGTTKAMGDNQSHVNITVVRIQWGAGPLGEDIVSYYVFHDKDALDETAFNSGALSWTTPSASAKSTFNYLSIGGGRFFVDELRLGTSFGDVIGAATGTGYNTWASANAGGQTPGQDYDNDGVANGIEYFMGQTGSSFTAMPGLFVRSAQAWSAVGSAAPHRFGWEALHLHKRPDSRFSHCKPPTDITSGK